MAKIQLVATLRKNDGTQIGEPINSGNKDSRTEAEAAIATVIQQRVDAANGAATELSNAQTAWNN